MTPLKKAAQEAIQMIESEDLSKWSSRHDKITIEALKAALNAEQAQAVEPVLFIHPETLVMSSAHVGAWKPGHELEGHLPLYLHPAPPPAMHLSEILAEKGITLQKTFVEKPRDTAPPPAGERAELIARLRDYDEYDNNKQAMSDAADMLEADATEKEYLKSVCLQEARAVDEDGQTIKNLRAEIGSLKAQQVAVPEREPQAGKRMVEPVYQVYLDGGWHDKKENDMWMYSAGGVNAGDVRKVYLHLPQQVAVPQDATTDNAAMNAAWASLRPALGTASWTASDNHNFRGFFAWGWEARRQYDAPQPPQRDKP